MSTTSSGIPIVRLASGKGARTKRARLAREERLRKQVAQERAPRREQRDER